jgi:hypothetical protein
MNSTARVTDPRSSQEAALEIEAKGIKAKQQEETLKLVATYGSGTRGEIANEYINEYLKSKPRREYTQDAIRALENQHRVLMGRRLPELAQHGLIELVEIRACKVANRSSQVWRCTGIGLAAVAALTER